MIKKFCNQCEKYITKKCYFPNHDAGLESGCDFWIESDELALQRIAAESLEEEKP